MKKIIFSILSFLLAFASVSASAQEGLSANQRVIGHTVSDRYDYFGVGFGEAGTYPVGALLYPSTLSFYKGCKIVGMRVAVAMDMGRTKMFVTDIEKGELFAPTQRLYEGWNNIFFNGDGYTITGDETLFYGMNYVETEEMVTKDLGGIVCMEDVTDGGFMIEQGGVLYPASGVGDICVQLIVDISALPSKNMTVSLMDTGFKYKQASEEIDMFFMLMNVGKDKVESFNVSVSFDGKEPTVYTVNEEIDPGATTTWEQFVPIPKDLGIGTHTVTGYISEVDGMPVADTSKTTQSATFALYENSLDRDAVYVEVYSHQSNVYSSLMDEVVNSMSSGMKDVLNITQVHAPGTSLAVPDAAWLHNVYAYTTPTFTSNRAYFPGEAHIAYDLNDFLGFLPSDFLIAIMEDIVMQDFYNPTFASLKLGGSYDPTTRKMTLSVSGDALPEAEAIYGDMAVTLMVVEDGVKARQMVMTASNSTKVDTGYIHNNVLRGFITSPIGDKIKVENGRFTAEYSYTLPGEFDHSNVRIAALLTKAGENITVSNAADYDVINTAEFKLGDFSGVEEISVEAEKEIEGVYTLDGLRQDSTALSSPGLHIVRYTDGSARKVVVK